MKNQLAAFGIIIMVGLGFALIGSNPASSALASLLTITANNTITQTSTTATTTTAPVTDTIVAPTQTTATPTGTTAESTVSAVTPSEPTAPIASTTTVIPVETLIVTPTQTQAQQVLVAMEPPVVVGIHDGEVVAGIRNVGIRVSGTPTAVRAEVRSPNGTVRPFYPNCSSAAPTICSFTFNTNEWGNGTGYQIKGLAKYADGSLLTTEVVRFAIANEVTSSGFIFIAPPAQATLSGSIQIQGESASASAVIYAIFSRGDEATPVMRGTAEHVGDIWLYQWDTQAMANGDYLIVPEIADRQGGSHKGAARSVSVRNETVITDSTPVVLQPMVIDRPIEPEAAVVPLREPTSELVKIPEPVITNQGGNGTGMSILAFQPTEAPKPASVGFFQNVRDVFRSVIAPQEETPKPVIITSEAVQKLEQLSNELNEEATAQSTLARIAKDADGDGISDFQEIEIVRTDPAKKDTDGDGVDDGTEVRQGTNPRNADRTAKIQYENAKLLGETVKPELLKIETVALATTTEVIDVEVIATTASGEVKTATEKKRVTKEKIKFTGKTLPHALVTIYVYSDIPTIVTVKADKGGSWSYALEKPLDDGQHQAYVTINDSEGRIVAKSQAVGFIKTAQAITIANIEDLAQAAENERPAPVEKSKRNFGIIVTLVIALGLLTGILMVVRSFRNPSNDVV